MLSVAAIATSIHPGPRHCTTGYLSVVFRISSGQDVDGRLIKVEVATGVRGGGAGRKGGDRGDRNGGRDRDRDRDFDKESR